MGVSLFGPGEATARPLRRPELDLKLRGAHIGCIIRNVQSADRALAILVAFSEERPELGVSELARELGMHKSTASRLLATLEARGLVRRVGDRYAPGPELVRLGAVAGRGASLLEAARPALVRLADDTRETVNLAVRRGDSVLNVHQVGSAHFVGLRDWTGLTTPLHATGNGKVLLAWGGAPLPAEPGALTRRTIVGEGELRAELERTRRRGWAQAVEELEEGLNSVAAPIFDVSGECVAAVSVAGPTYRLPPRQLGRVGRRCVAAADEISTALGRRRAA
jgi:DNA-binding IclR family transcriptional regulator